MANHLYGSYNPSGYGGAASNLSSVYPDQYSSRYLTGTDSNLSSYASLTDRTLYGHTDSAYSSAASRLSWPGPPGVDVSGAAAVDPLYAGLKRPPSDALYHQTVLGAHNTLGTEAWYSTNPLAKRPRFESASNLPIYPQRPGEKDCAHYMLTRTCKFAESCKFDHPIWVPEGGIPDWKEQVPLDVTTEVLPERPGEADCPYFLKTQRCKFGPRCKFNHPKDNVVPSGAQDNADASALPVRPSEPTCAFYSKTGSCKFGATCKFNHPKDIVIPPAVPENGTGGQNAAVTTETAVKPLFTPASLHNTKGLPIRPGEVDCPFYLKTGSCKYGATCRYNHPDRYAITPSVAFVASPAAHLNMGVVNPAASLLQTIDPRLTQTAFPTIYPQRPGQLECDFYMKTGICKFGETCKYHHPIDRTVHTQAREAAEQNVKLSLAGLPRREGAVHCPYYMKTGTCKYGATCKFDHPPPGEVMATATTTAAVATQGEDAQAVQE